VIGTLTYRKHDLDPAAVGGNVAGARLKVAPEALRFRSIWPIPSFTVRREDVLSITPVNAFWRFRTLEFATRPAEGKSVVVWFQPWRWRHAADVLRSSGYPLA
jgi:hypothetical protein